MFCQIEASSNGLMGVMMMMMVIIIMMNMSVKADVDTNDVSQGVHGEDDENNG